MKIEAGKTYRTRGGDLVRVETTNGDGSYEVVGTYLTGATVNGTALRLPDGSASFTVDEHPGDLVEEVTPPLKIEAGKSYRTRDGRRADIKSVTNSHPRYPVIGHIRDGTTGKCVSVGPRYRYLLHWTDAGCFLDGKLMGEDLVAPWEDVVSPTPPEPTSTIRTDTLVELVRELEQWRLAAAYTSREDVSTPEKFNQVHARQAFRKSIHETIAKEVEEWRQVASEVSVAQAGTNVYTPRAFRDAQLGARDAEHLWKLVTKERDAAVNELAKTQRWLGKARRAISALRNLGDAWARYYARDHGLGHLDPAHKDILNAVDDVIVNVDYDTGKVSAP